jgi:thiol peroxidase
VALLVGRHPVIGADGNVAYTELVPEIGVELSYDAGLSALGSSV